MEKYEILFAILIIIAYIICSLTLKIPIHAHVWSDTISGTDNCNTFKIQTKV